MIPYGRQDITDADLEAVKEVLRSDFLTQGPSVPQFEQRLADYCDADHAIAVNSATSALHIACLALNLGPGDWLWTTPITFVASANCALYCGARVDFVDIDSSTYNICPDALETKLADAEINGRLPKVVVPVHMCGEPCDMDRIKALSNRFGFRIIEDASHAVGGTYGQKKIGACSHSDITIFSFHPVKIITTAEGGMALTNSIALAERMRRLRSHGITRDASEMTQKPDGDWYYQQVDLGYNYRMTDLQAALGISQLQRLDNYVQHRLDLVARYDLLLKQLPIITQRRSSNSRSAIHLYVIRIKKPNNRRTVFDFMRKHGIGVNVHYIPVHTQPYYRGLGFLDGDFPNAESYYEEALSLPLYPAMTSVQQDDVIDVIKRALA